MSVATFAAPGGRSAASSGQPARGEPGDCRRASRRRVGPKRRRGAQALSQHAREGGQAHQTLFKESMPRRRAASVTRPDQRPSAPTEGAAGRTQRSCRLKRRRHAWAPAPTAAMQPQPHRGPSEKQSLARLPGAQSLPREFGWAVCPRSHSRPPASAARARRARAGRRPGRLPDPALVGSARAWSPLADRGGGMGHAVPRCRTPAAPLTDRTPRRVPCGWRLDHPHAVGAEA
jgi:hypothetical protein